MLMPEYIVSNKLDDMYPTGKNNVINTKLDNDKTIKRVQFISF